MPVLPTNLVRIGAVYKFRSRIPTDLLRLYAPKVEVTESLRTKSLTEARRLLPAVQLRYQQEWANLRAALKEDFTDLVLNETGINYVIAAFEHESLAGDEAIRNAGHYDLEEVRDYRERLTESIAFLRDAAAIHDLDVIKPALEQYLQLKKLNPIGTPEDLDQLALAYLRGAIRTNEALLARMRGDVAAPSTPPPSLTGRVQRPAASGSHISLYSLFEYWRDAVAGREQKTIDDVEKRIRDLDALTAGKSASELTKADIIAYRDARLQKGLKPRTVEKDLSFIKAVLQHAHDSDKLAFNPAAGTKVPQAKMPSLPRHLDIESLQALFGSSIYTEGRRPEGGAGEAAAWLPLLALYTGARLEELCQLTCDDVRTSGKITYLRLLDLIDEGADKEVKRLKNEGSRRDIPLAPALVTLGFLDYVAHQRQQGQTWLFPVLVPDGKYGRRGGNWSKWWSRWRRTLGVGGREKCFHAFRHAFKTACRAAGIGEDVHDALTGHSGGGVGREYGHFPLVALDKAIRRVRYPELKITWKWQPPQ